MNPSSFTLHQTLLSSLQLSRVPSCSPLDKAEGKMDSFGCKFYSWTPMHAWKTSLFSASTSTALLEMDKCIKAPRTLGVSILLPSYNPKPSLHCWYRCQIFNQVLGVFLETQTTLRCQDVVYFLAQVPTGPNLKGLGTSSRTFDFILLATPEAPFIPPLHHATSTCLHPFFQSQAQITSDKWICHLPRISSRISSDHHHHHP